MQKKRITLEDGRYLIYYSFPDGPPKRKCGGDKSTPESGGETDAGKRRRRPRV